MSCPYNPRGEGRMSCPCDFDMAEQACYNRGLQTVMACHIQYTKIGGSDDRDPVWTSPDGITWSLVPNISVPEPGQ